MAADQERTLLRGPESSQRATFLELFLDLVYVFALTRVTQRLIDEFHSGNRIEFAEAGQSLVLLLALWLLWALTAWMTSRFDPQRLTVQLIVVATMFAAMLMAVTLPNAYTSQGALFAVPYVVMQLGRPGWLWFTLRGQPRRQRISVRLLFWFGLSGVLWLTGALAPPHLRWIFWTVAVLLDYGGSALRWPTPRVGPVVSAEWGLAGEHLAERYQQFFLISLGEAILVAGLSFSGGGFAPERTGSFVLAFLTTVLLWRVYFHRAGSLLAEAITTSRDASRFIRSATYTHLVMVSGVIATAVGYQLVITQPLGRTAAGWISVILGGPVLFLLGRARFEFEVFARVAWSRLVGVAALVLLTPTMLVLAPVAIAGAAAGVLAAIAGYDAMRRRGQAPELPSSPL